MTATSIIHIYADVFGLDRDEVMAWVKSYINRPGDFPRLIELGLIEDTKEARKASIQAYLQREVDKSTTGRIRASIAKEKAEKVTEQDMREAV